MIWIHLIRRFSLTYTLYLHYAAVVPSTWTAYACLHKNIGNDAYM
jgi:hypothetical protein